MAITKYLIPFEQLTETHKIRLDDYLSFLKQEYTLQLDGKTYSISRADFALADHSMRTFLLTDVAMELLAIYTQTLINQTNAANVAKDIPELIRATAERLLTVKFGIEFEDSMDRQTFTPGERLYSVETGSYQTYIGPLPEELASDGYTVCVADGDQIVRARPVDLVKKY